MFVLLIIQTRNLEYGDCTFKNIKIKYLNKGGSLENIIEILNKNLQKPNNFLE